MPEWNMLINMCILKKFNRCVIKANSENWEEQPGSLGWGPTDWVFSLPIVDQIFMTPNLKLGLKFLEYVIGYGDIITSFRLGMILEAHLTT